MELDEQILPPVSTIALQLIAEDNEADMKKPHLLISRYNHEKATNKDYNGRQLLELIQNADDAGSEYVSIHFDKAGRHLRIANSGDPFTMEGFRSLMVPNLSSKIKKQYIGNKGLGFRSVLNWSEEVTVYSAGNKMCFSRQAAKEQFNIWYPAKLRAEIRREFSLPDDIVPMPLFAVPKIDGSDEFPGQTVIDIKFLDGAEEDIDEQLGSLQAEVLLFLNYIKEIRITGTDVPVMYTAIPDGNKISIGDRSWTIYDNKVDGEDPALPTAYRDKDTTESEFYSLKVALQEGLKDDVNQLFCFFPTKIKMNFPAVIHGTFELDSSRNRIIVSDKNKFLAAELLNLLFKVAVSAGSGWERFRLLNYYNQTDSYLGSMGFYTSIDNFVKTAPVLPCADGQFRNYGSVYILPEVFSEQIFSLRQEENFPELMQKVPDAARPYFDHLFKNYGNDKRYSPAALKARIEAASLALFTAVDAVAYARWIAAIRALYSTKAPQPLNVLYSEWREMADGQDTLFTPSDGSKIEIPKHATIKYLHPDLYKALTALLVQPGENQSRGLRTAIANFTDIISFEPQTVLFKIVSETKRAMREDPEAPAQKFVVMQMIASIFGYYTGSDKAKNTPLKLVRIPAINAADAVVFAGDTFLSPRYPSGTSRMDLLGDWYRREELIAAPEALGLPDTPDTENFLVNFLGVNRYIAIDTFDEARKYDPAYNDYVFRNIQKPNNFYEGVLYGSHIRNESRLRDALRQGSLSYENFVTWACTDPEISGPGGGLGDTRFNYVMNTNRNGNPQPLGAVPSYVEFQLRRITGFSEFVLDIDNVDYMNAIPFDRYAHVLQNAGLSEERVKNMLLLCGAKNQFGDLQINRIREILTVMPEKDPNGRHARKVYKLCADRFKAKQEALADKTGLELHVTVDGKKEYAPWEKVFYNRKISLPARITRGKPLLNYPKRGAENNITGFFGVQTFDDLNFVARDYTPYIEATNLLGRHLRKIRPFILLKRLASLQSGDEKKEALRAVKSLEIILCKQLNYTLAEETRKAEEYDFVSKDKFTWLVRYTGSATMEALVKNAHLSDVVSEIWSITFDLAAIADDISLFYRDEGSYVRHRMEKEYGEGELEDAISKLEVSDAERDFWSAIFRVSSAKVTIPADDEEGDFRKEVAAALGISQALMSGIDFSQLSYPNNLPRFQELFSRLGVTLAAFNTDRKTALSFLTLHLEKFTAAAAQRSQELMAALWLECSQGGKVQQRNFMDTLSRLPDTLAQPLARRFKDEVLPDYTGEMAAAIAARFPELPSSPEPYQSQYKANTAALRCSNSDVNNLPVADQSQLYFPLSAEDTDRIRAVLHPPAPAPPAGETQPGEEEPALPVSDLEQAPEGADRTPPGADNNKKPSGGGGGGYGSGSDDKKKALGLRAEKAVLRTLTNKEHEWMSGYSSNPAKNDRIGYDIRYKENPGDDWTFIEVKWFESGLFRLPDTEFNFARKHADRYYIYLVREHSIEKVLFKDLVNADDNEFDRDNRYFSFAVSEYKFKQLPLS